MDLGKDMETGSGHLTPAKTHPSPSTESTYTFECVKLDTKEVDLKLQGTTALTFFYVDGIMFGVDSKASNEQQAVHPLVIKTTQKWYHVTQKANVSITAVQLGNLTESENLRIHLQNSCANAYSVEDVVKAAKVHMKTRLSKKRKFGVLIVGRDLMGGFQMYRVYVEAKTNDPNKFICDDERNKSYFARGSGEEYALQVFDSVMNTDDTNRDNYDRFKSKDEAANLTLEALFHASYNDLHTGGTLYVLCVNKEKVEVLERCSILNAYLKLYDKYKEEKTIFLAYSSSKEYETIYTEDLKSFFGAKICHHVAHVDKAEGAMNFHRLVFESKEEALDAIKNRTTPNQVAYWTHQVVFNTEKYQHPREEGKQKLVLLHLCLASKQVLQTICDAFKDEGDAI